MTISDKRPRMFAQIARRAALSTRNFTTSAARRGGDGLPPPGDNLPFSINNRSGPSRERKQTAMIVFQIQADSLLHPLLWQRTLHPLHCHETSAPQEIILTTTWTLS